MKIPGPLWHRRHKYPEPQKSTLAWTAACLDEAWVIVSQGDAQGASLEINALRADINALHGTGGS